MWYITWKDCYKQAIRNAVTEQTVYVPWVGLSFGDTMFISVFSYILPFLSLAGTELL